jgi:flagellar biosynthesis/type III secretory pathway protein FliH
MLYVRLYPLFQQAYEELGNLDGYFNDRVIEVIDDLLATPEIIGPIALTQPHVMFEFADAELESRSTGQKLLLRMGPENAARVKAKLREFRERIATPLPPA